MKLKTMLSMCILALLFSGCCILCSQNNATFTEADSGKTFTTSPGSTLNVDLKGNYTTGYSWNIVSIDKKILTLSPDSEYVSDTFSPGMTGVGGVQHYIFNVVGKGETELKITYNRVWEKDVAPARTFTLKVISE